MLNRKQFTFQSHETMTLQEIYYKEADHIFNDDFTSGFNHFKELATHGMPLAIYRLGKCYFYGQGTAKNLHLAVQHLKEAACLGIARADYILAEIFKKSHPRVAAAYYLKAANAGEADASWAIANAYKIGLGVEINLEKAIQWFEVAKQKGCQNCESNIQLITRMLKKKSKSPSPP